MKLDLIQQHIREFVAFLETRESGDHLFKYAMLSHFRQVWTYDTEDFAAMYDRALQSDVTRRWWKREGYRPKEVMLLLIHAEPQYARQAFKELFNEQHQVENRIDRFIFYCDEILKLHKRLNPRDITNNHNQDSAILSFYLGAMYPDQYTLYPGRLIFNRGLIALGAQGTGEKDDLPRFFKLSRTIYQYLIKEPSVIALIDNGLRPAGDLLLAHEWFLYTARAWHEMAAR